MKEGIIQSDVKTGTQPRVLLKPGSWLAKIDFINHLILFNNVLVTVLSEKEGGKTSFAALLQSNLDQQIKSAIITIQPPYNKETLIKDIATQLQLAHDEATDIISLVKQVNERKFHVLLLIDDAHHLPDDFIKELLQTLKNQEDFSFFHLCFLSDYSIIASLNPLSASLGENLIHTIELGALNESETRTYVLQRAMTAHLISKPLSDAQFKQFYQLTKGNLAKINNDLDTFVQKCDIPKQKELSPVIKTAGLAAVTVLIGGFLGFYLSQSFNFSSSSHEIITPVKKEPIQTIALRLPDLTEKLVSYIAPWQDASTRQLVYSSLPKKDVLEDLDDEYANETTAIVDKVVVIPKLQAQTKVLAVTHYKIPTAKPFVAKSKLTTNSIEKKVKLNKIAKPLIKPSKPIAELYTIQIVAAHNKKEIERFLKKNKVLAKNAKLRHFSNTKGNWYVLTVGEYKNKTQAQQSVKQLPQILVKSHPWVRTISSIG